MSRKHFIALARTVGRSLGCAYVHGGEPARTALYTVLYEDVIELCRSQNHNFDSLRFAYAVEVAEQDYINNTELPKLG